MHSNPYIESTTSMYITPWYMYILQFYLPVSCARQVTGSHDHSLRLWEKTDEPLILSEERERVSP